MQLGFKTEDRSENGRYHPLGDKSKTIDNRLYIKEVSNLSELTREELEYLVDKYFILKQLVSEHNSEVSKGLIKFSEF